MRKLHWQKGGAEEAKEAETSGPNIVEDVGAAVEGAATTFKTGGLSTIFGIIVIVMELVLRFLWFLFTVVIPFMVIYFGIPLFILGAIMALIFTVGHIFFLVAFFVGVFLYMRGMIRVAFPTSLFNVKSTSKSSSKNNGSK